MWKRIHKNVPLPSKLGYIGWRLRSQIKRRQIITFRRKITVRKQEKSQLLSDENFEKHDLLWKIHWNTKTCKSEEMSSIQLYACCGPMSLICTRAVITYDSVLKLNYNLMT